MKIGGVMFRASLTMLVIASCSSAVTTSETFVTTTVGESQSLILEPTSTVVVTTSSIPNPTSTLPQSSAEPSASSISGVSPSSSTSLPSSTSTSVVTTKKLSVSQTTNLNPLGTSVTVRGTGYDVAKGVYVIVCTQAAPGPQATCVGGVNIDGSSSSSVWVSSNPPNYAVGLTTPFLPDGSFNIELVIVAKSGAIDCTVVKCGVVTRSDHLRYTDRTQDVFVPITFTK